MRTPGKMLRHICSVILMTLFLGIILTSVVQFAEQESDPNHAPTHQVKCPEGRVVTSIHGGRFGNQVWEYASVWAAVKIYSSKEEPLLGYSTTKTLDTLAEAFERMSLPALRTVPLECLNTSASQIIHFYEKPKFNSALSLKSPIIMNEGFRVADVLDVGLESFRQEFRLKKELLENSRRRLLEAKRKLNRVNETDTTFIGVHYRGTDYPGFLRMHNKNATRLVTPGFYARAMDFMRIRHRNTLFVVVSDDRKWCERNIKGSNVVVSENNDRKNDLALLASCNHSIISYGTFATTAAVLAGGDTVLYQIRQKINGYGAKLPTEISKRIGNWFAMD